MDGWTSAGATGGAALGGPGGHNTDLGGARIVRLMHIMAPIQPVQPILGRRYGPTRMW
jgi:hypothetical protein